MNLTIQEWILIHKAMRDKVHAVTEIMSEMTDLGVAIKKEKIWDIFVKNDALAVKIYAHMEELRNEES